MSDKQCGVKVRVQLSAPWGCQGSENKPKVLGFEHQYSKKFYLAFSSPHLQPASPLPPFFKPGSSDMPSCLPCASLTSNSFHLIVLLPLSAPSCRNYWWQNSSSLGPGQMSSCHSAPTPSPKAAGFTIPAFFFLFSHRESRALTQWWSIYLACRRPLIQSQVPQKTWGS